jgi:hypothetical protein
MAITLRCIHAGPLLINKTVIHPWESKAS